MDSADRIRKAVPELAGGDVNALAGPGRFCQAPGCRRPLPGRRRRFCSDLCRVKGQRAERVTEDDAYVAGVRRLTAASARRAGGDLVTFALFAEAVDFARARLQEAADQLLAQGYSYGDIGRALGITRQGARQRFARQQEVVAQDHEETGTWKRPRRGGQRTVRINEPA